MVNLIKKHKLAAIIILTALLAAAVLAAFLIAKHSARGPDTDGTYVFTRRANQSTIEFTRFAGAVKSW